MLGYTEILVIALAILIFFGAKRIPEIFKAFGRASYEFKKAKENIKQESKEFIEAAEESAAAQDDQVKKDDGKQK
ncbi:MAG: twin-arginine translocase TatA/TatE family subunit [Endomicrobium sp.]|jgi:sec-independent protein translocase protein TatA|nr:twin-arginine translocase TatA/TatE family subunit [Endomicrobium sp.]